MGLLGGTAIGIEAMEVHVGGGGGIAIATGATIGEGATVMIVAEAITAGTTTEMIAANIVGGGADDSRAGRTGFASPAPTQ